MLLFLSILIAVVALAIFVSGLLALLSNPQKLQNRWFFIFVTFLALWIPSNFVDSNIIKPLWSGLALKLDFSLALFIAWALVQFTDVFSIKALSASRPSHYRKTLGSTTFILNTVFTIFIFAGLLVTSSISHAKLVISYSDLFTVYVVILLFYFAYAFVRLFRKRKVAHPEEKPALNLIFAGTFVAAIANILTNLVFPLAITDTVVVKELNIIGYAGLFVMVLSVYLAITVQKLFDIRLIVARSLAYIFSLVSLGAVFTIGAFALTGIIFSSNDLNSTATRWVYTVLAVALAYAFPPLKRFFDKNTNRLFFRDSYNTQAFLDDFNKLLVATYDLSPLLRKSARIIESNLKPAYTVFGLRETESAPRRIMGTSGHPEFTESDIAYVRAFTPKMHRKLIVTDLLEEKYGELQKVLRTNNIAVIARLASSTNEEGIGYLVLGPKKSGNLYSTQDLKVIEIVANELVIAIQNALRFEEIANFNLTLQAKVDEATRNLRKANQRLKELDETKDDFISMASHQLRTPLTSVKGYISMVLEGDAGKINETQRKLLEQSFFSSQRMVFLISDLLNVSRLRTGKFVIEPVPVNLADMVEQEMDQLRETAAGKELTLTYEKPAHFPTLMLDETKTRQVIMNFADNAIYYTPTGGHIRVELRETPASVELRVVDDGIGVPKAEQHHLFTKFYRAGNARKARPDGTGLGLFMAKKVVVAQGGAIIFESEEGKGSTFGFVFSKTKLVTNGGKTPPAAKQVVEA